MNFKYLILTITILGTSLAMNYCTEGKCGRCELAANGTDLTCKSCFYSKPDKISDGVYQCLGNEFPLVNCIAVSVETPTSCMVCANGYGMLQPQQTEEEARKNQGQVDVSCKLLNIKNCKLGIFLKDGTQNCFVCDQDHQLSSDKKTCIKLARSKKIGFCQEYQTDTETQNPICTVCQPGYTLDIHFNSCTASSDKTKCTITKGLSANDDGTCMRCSTTKFFFAVDLKDNDNSKQECVFKSYWSTGLKVGVIVLAILFFLAIGFISFKKISKKGLIEQRDEYFEA